MNRTSSNTQFSEPSQKSVWHYVVNEVKVTIFKEGKCWTDNKILLSKLTSSISKVLIMRWDQVQRMKFIYTLKNIMLNIAIFLVELLWISENCHFNMWFEWHINVRFFLQNQNKIDVWYIWSSQKEISNL